MKLNKLTKYLGLLIICLVLPLIPRATVSASGSVQKSTTAGEVLSGDYVVITNENFDDGATQNTGDMTGGSVSTASTAEGEKQKDEPEGHTQREAEIETQGVAPKSYNIGTTKTISGIIYEVIAISDHAYIWMNQSLKGRYQAAGKLTQAGQEMGEVYEGAPYEVLKDMSKDKIPYNDGTGKISIMMDILKNSGHFMYMSDITAIFVNVPEANDYKAGKLGGLAGLLAHEGQHALFANLINGGDIVNGKQFSWINEGMAVATMDYLWGGDDPTGWMSRIENSAELRGGSTLLYGTYRGNAEQDYSIPYAFVRYLIAQKGKGYDPLPFFQSLFELKTYVPGGKKLGNEEFIQAILDKNQISMTAKEAISNFYIALSAQQPNGVYGFYGDPIVYKNVPQFPEYPFKEGENVALKGTASIVVPAKNGKFTVPSGAGPDITFTAIKRAKNIFNLKGSGTKDDPYQIHTAKDMSAMQLHSGAHFKLMKDIDFQKQGGLAWQYTVPIFSGILEGGGKTIKNVDKPLFKENGGIVKDLRIEAAFTGDHSNMVGVIANMNSGTIKDIEISGTVNIRMTGTNPGAGGEQLFGTVAGRNQSTIERVGTDARITINMLSNNSHIGGLVGYNRGSILNSYSQASLTVNQNHGGTASKAYSVYTGGMVGYWKRQFSMTGIVNTYSTAQVDVQTGGAPNLDLQTGRLVGFVETDVRTPVESTYALEGMPASGNSTSMIPASVSKSEADMKNQATYKKWDFNAVWQMPSKGYPKHRAFGSGGGITASFKKTQYYTGEQLDISTQDKINYQGSLIKITKDMVSGFDSSRPGDITVTVSYRGETVDMVFVIQDPGTVESLKIASHPSRTRYVEGQKFSPDGLILEAVKSGSKLKIYSAYVYDKTNPLTTADTQVTVTYGGKSVNVPITVEKPSVQSLTAIAKPDPAKVYYAGSTLDLSELSLQITYSDGAKSPVFKSADFEKYDIQFVLVDTKTEQIITMDEPLTIDANGKALFACVGTPGRDAPKAMVIQLKVVQGIYLPEQNIRMVAGKANYESTDQLAAYCEFTLKSGSKPSWLSIATAVNDMLILEGTPTAGDVGEFTLVYAAKAVNTGQTIDIKLNISVENPSNKVELESFNLLRSNNSVLSKDVTGVINEDGQGNCTSISLIVPGGTNVTNLEPTWTPKEGSATNVGTGFESGQSFDFTNTVNYIFVPEDGTRRTVPVTVTFAAPALSGNADLSGINGLDLKETFNSNRLQYTAEVENSVASLTGVLEPVVSDTGKATFTVSGADVLKVGNNKIFIDVRAENGTLKRYTITVERKPYIQSGNAYLQEIGGITLDQAFDRDTKEYTASVSNDTSVLNVTAKPEDPKAVVTIKGNGNIEVGENTIHISVVAENGVVDSYRIVVTRLQSANAFLSSLRVDSYTLNPAFDKNVFDYAITVKSGVTSLLVEAEAEDVKAAVVIEGADSLEVGANEVFVRVTAQDGTIKTYTIHATRETPGPQASSNAFLQSISGVNLDQSFDKNSFEYTATVGNKVTSLNIAAVPEDSTATVEISGADSLAVGENIVKIKVTAQDGSIKEYVIKVYRVAETPTAIAEYATMRLTGLESGAVYIIEKENIAADGAGAIAIKKEWSNTEISIVKKGNGAGTDSEEQKLSIKTIYSIIVNGQERAISVEGEKVTVQAERVAGYRFLGWTATGVTLDNPAKEEITFTMGPQNVVLTTAYTVLISTKPEDMVYDGRTEVRVNFNIPVAEFRYIEVDGRKLERDRDYTVAPGAPIIQGFAYRIASEGTEIVFKKAYLETLKDKTNSFIAVFASEPVDFSIRVANVPGKPTTFPDVRPNDWFYGAVNYVSSYGFMSGYANGNFGPADSLSRGQFATILYRMEGSPAIQYSGVFSDVPSGQFYSLPAIWGKANNIITGYANGNFGPLDSLTREQLVTMMYRYAQVKGLDVSIKANLEEFPDVQKVTSFARGPLSWAVGIGLVKGDQGELNPQGICSRAVIATIIQRFQEKY